VRTRPTVRHQLALHRLLPFGHRARLGERLDLLDAVGQCVFWLAASDVRAKL
jgi:hypothetical protein